MAKMNDTLNQLFPLIVIASIYLAIFTAIGIKVSNNKNSKTPHENWEYRKLSKSKSNKVIAGVCGGVAEYFGWNATFVRLFFLFSGIGVFTYAILAIALPDSESPLL